MRANEALDILQAVTDAGARVWVDGGWGVDALIGTSTREHNDLDLVVRHEDLDIACRVLTAAGFTTVLRDWLPAALALGDDHGREVDLHPVSPADDGGGYQHLPDGTAFHYPPPVPGTIGGRPVSCVDAHTQAAAHHDYPARERDHHDMGLLRERFGVAWTPG